MPRSKAERAFGFRSRGLLRILTGADIDEVLDALEQLGLFADSFVVDRSSFEKSLDLFRGIHEVSFRRLDQQFQTIMVDILNILDVGSTMWNLLGSVAEGKFAISTRQAWSDLVPPSVNDRILWFRNVLSDLYVLEFDNLNREMIAALNDMRRLVDMLPDPEADKEPLTFFEEFLRDNPDG